MAMKFNITKTELAGVLVIEPAVYGDSRGFFLETFNQKRYARREFLASFSERSGSLIGQSIPIVSSDHNIP